MNQTPKVYVTAEPCLGKELKPGELFSVAGPSYWNKSALGSEAGDHPDPSLGERVYIRTNVVAPPEEMEERVYRIRIHQVGGR